jgi:predicted metalloprotease
MQGPEPMTILPSIERLHLQRCRKRWQKATWKLTIASSVVAIMTTVPAARAQNEVLQSVDQTIQFLISNWNKDDQLRKVTPPQVIPLAAGSKVYGACGEQIRGVEVSGSAYCAATHTIYLVPEELQAFYHAFGPSAVGYVVAHEFGHAIQAAFRVELEESARELQADCLAGLIIRSGAQELGLTRDNVLAMAHAAYSIGSNSHGSGAQRSYALLSGMGVLKASCESTAMQELADEVNKDSDYLELSRQRSGANRLDTSQTLHPKTLKTALEL